jgi:hypothetical protein
MVGRSSDATTSGAAKSGPTSSFQLGSEPTEAMLRLRCKRNLLDTYEQLGRTWLARVQSEVDLWTGLAAKLAATAPFLRPWGHIRNVWCNGCK